MEQLHLCDLPSEILFLICNFIKINDLIDLANTNHKFNTIFREICKQNPYKILKTDRNLYMHIRYGLLISNLINYCQFCKVHDNSYYYVNDNDRTKIVIACKSCHYRVGDKFCRISHKLTICPFNCEDDLKSSQGLCDMCNKKIDIVTTYGYQCPGNGKCYTNEWDYYTCSHNEEGCSEILYNNCHCSYRMSDYENCFNIDDEFYDEVEFCYEAYIVKHKSDSLYVCEKCIDYYHYDNESKPKHIIHSKYGYPSCKMLPKLTKEYLHEYYLNKD